VKGGGVHIDRKSKKKKKRRCGGEENWGCRRIELGRIDDVQLVLRLCDWNENFLKHIKAQFLGFCILKRRLCHLLQEKNELEQPEHHSENT
jgi:hypothetical protein